MYKLLIVEDEKWIREGIEEYWDWNNYDIEIIKSAKNGQEGLELVKKSMPDIVITDIRMPKMSGLEMSNQIKKLFPNIKIIILTGYDDFEYAKKAIDFNVTGFLLKPIEAEELKKYLEKAKSEIDEYKKYQLDLEEIDNHIKEKTNLAKKNYLKGMLQEKIRIDEVYNNLKETDFIGDNIEYVICGIYYDNRMKNSQLLRDSIIEMTDDGIIIFESEVKTEMYICFYWNKDEKYDFESMITMIQEEAKEVLIDISIGISQVANNLEELVNGYKRLKSILDSLILFDAGRRIYCADEYIKEELSKFDTQDFVLRTHEYTSQIILNVKKKNTEKVMSLLDDLFEFLNHTKNIDRNLVVSMFSGLLSETSFALVDLMDNTELVYGKQNRLIRMLFDIHSFGELVEFITNVYFNIMNYISENQESCSNDLVRNALLIVDNRFDENINIKTTAGELFVSPYYLGQLFKKEMGKTFGKYLLDIRMEKAIEFLQNPNIKIKKISKLLGIDNQSYFCALFKKYYHLSPGEYRKNLLKIEDGNVSWE